MADDVCSELDPGWSPPQPTTASHDGEDFDRSRAGTPRCTPNGLRRLACGVDQSKPRRTSLSEEAGKRAPASADVIPERKPDESYAESRENGMHALRHFYASVLLDTAENIKAFAEYLGHSDPGLTLRVYAHLMPSDEERTRTAITQAYEASMYGRDLPYGP
ncbi:hypothetical protein ACIQPR_06090 [Streptomyces sp. NPDC091280]|uniref:hypothetical protein n=1 Tax=Streptomyces sp. NPDC091280 TaxID=3365984 RepID=UPI003822FAE3